MACTSQFEGNLHFICNRLDVERTAPKFREDRDNIQFGGVIRFVSRSSLQRKKILYTAFIANREKDLKNLYWQILHTGLFREKPHRSGAMDVQMSYTLARSCLYRLCPTSDHGQNRRQPEKMTLHINTQIWHMATHIKSFLTSCDFWTNTISVTLERPSITRHVIRSICISVPYRESRPIRFRVRPRNGNSSSIKSRHRRSQQDPWRICAQ